jgi:hypothetical protein
MKKLIIKQQYIFRIFLEKIQLAPVKRKSKNKFVFIFHQYFYVQYYPGSGSFFLPGSRIQIRDGAMVGSGSGINHSGSATLP